MMTTSSRFFANCKMRHDFDDQIQVRYHHTNGEDYDTWVSGNEVLGRMRSKATEERLRGIQNLDWQQIREAQKRLPDEAKKRAERWLLDILADGVEENLGGNIFGDTLAGAIRVENQEENSAAINKERWTNLLYDDHFRTGVLEIAWIQLEGSFPEGGSNEGTYD